MNIEPECEGPECDVGDALAGVWRDLLGFLVARFSFLRLTVHLDAFTAGLQYFPSESVHKKDQKSTYLLSSH